MGYHIIHVGDQPVETVHGVQVEPDFDVVVLVGGDYKLGIILVTHEVDPDDIDDVTHGTLADVVALVRRFELGLDLLARVQQFYSLFHVEYTLLRVILM